MTYDGLNNLLQSEDSLAAGTRSFTSSTDFDTSNEIPTNYIANSNIRTITADKINAGTINSTVVYAGSVSASQIRAGTFTGFTYIVNDGTTDRVLIGYGSGLF